MKQKKDRQKIYFTSDLHFCHTNILYHCPERRNFLGISLEELQNDKKGTTELMNQKLIELWNNTVRKQDSIYFLGDFCLANKVETKKILEQLHGKKYLIVGNHDNSLKGLENYFEDVSQIKELKVTNNQFKFIDPDEPFCLEMCHYPLLTWNRRLHGTIMLHGHCHGSLNYYNNTSKELRLDVGFDSSVFRHQFIEVEDLYKYFVSLREQLDCKTFEEYTNKLIDLKNAVRG